jgi:hypothetical protein
MPGTRYALNRTERRNSHLHRSARCTTGQLGQQRSHSVTQVRTLWFRTAIQRVQRSADRLGFIVRRGHVGTIRPAPPRLVRAPGSRDGRVTRHSGRRCFSRGIFSAPIRDGRNRATGRRWT